MILKLITLDLLLFPAILLVDLGVMTTLRRVDINMISPEIDQNYNATNIQVWGRDNIDFAQTRLVIKMTL